MQFRWLALMLLGCASAPAQSLFGTILGTVTDTSQAVIPGAQVRIRNTATNALRIVATDAAGDFQAPTLPVGVYEVSVEARGFKRAVISALSLAVDQRARVDMQLEVGAVEQVVEVASAAPLIETDSASQGTVVDNRRIVQLPLNGRNFQQLAVLAPGVTAPVAGSGERFAVAGTRGLSNSFMMDGASNTNSNANTTFINPSVDLIQEFKIQRNTFNAEYGRGAAQINVVTKSGTNSLHFTLFEFLRNDRIQARNFFDGARKPALRRNQFGGTVGGPVLIPKLYDGRNRTFWLFNYEAVRQRNPITQLASVPTQAELSGDLSTVAGAINDPFGGNVPFAGNQIPASRINASSARYREFVPLSTAPRGAFGPGINYVNPLSTRNGFDQFTVRGDHNITSTSNVFVRYSLNDNESYGASLLPQYQQSGLSRQHNAVAGHNHVIRPTLINELRANFSRHSLNQGPAFQFDRNMAELFGLRNLLGRTEGRFNALPTVNITGFAGMGGPALITQRVRGYSLLDNLTWIRGAHTVKAGADLRRSMLDIRNIGATNGSFAFQGLFTRSAIADFLLGIPRTAAGTAPPGPDGVNWMSLWQWFVQDDWKVTSDLTLSLGVRYEYGSPWVNSRDQRSIFDPSFPGGRLIYPGQASYYVPGRGFIDTDKPLASRGLVPPDKNNLAPRFGFAWRPFGSRDNSVRGSYGIFYEASNANNEVLFGTFNYPHVLNHSLTNDASRQLFFWNNMFPDQVTVGNIGFSSLAPNLPTGYVQQWSFNLQREVRQNLAVEVGYMGSKGTKLDWRNRPNQAVLDADPARPTPLASRLPFRAFAPTANTITRDGFSNYHAFIARVERSFSNGLSFLAAYTGSKSIDNSSFAGNVGAQPAEAQNAYDRNAEKGLSYWDVPQRLVVSYIWDLPFGKGRRWLNAGGAADRILGGWQFSGITQFQSGNPWSVLVAADPANVGNGGQRADLVGNPFPEGFTPGGPRRLRLDPTAFAIPRRGFFGTSGRNIIRDAPTNQWDLNIAKDFSIAERMRLEFRTEIFNLWNHTQFNQFDNTVNNPTFGTWRSARPPRIIQFGLKLVY
ncbi:MAG: TonB-dependent receptor [Bryobacteraceae bacterium]|nr:TonB-dependent receptor [Bryobacteraceae bacterium]